MTPIDRPGQPGAQRTVEGHGVSPGIAIGEAHLRESGAITVPEYILKKSDVDGEVERFDHALALARRQVERLSARARSLPEAASEELGFLLDAYQQMLKESRLIRGVRRRIREDRLNAEAAVQSELTEISAAFAQMDDAYIAARRDDIREVAHRLVRNLTKTPHTWFSTLPKGSIILAEEITPSDTARMDPKTIAGFASVMGGAEGHTSIMARALGIPAVVGIADFMKDVNPGDTLIVDGDLGKVIVNPNKKTLDVYRRRRADMMADRRRLASLARRRSITRDGTSVRLEANVELPLEMDGVASMGAAGIGLLRTEFMFMNRRDLPGEDEQYEVFRDMLEKLEGRPISIRTLDVGGEKLASSLGDSGGGSVASVLGMRGIRLSLSRLDILEAQFSAMLRASVHGPVRIILPMVSSVSEVRKARQILMKVASRLERRGIELSNGLPPLGVMIEVPGAALSADALAKASDFFAIGSNDLIMYTLAIDRSDDEVADLYDPLHPAVLRLMQFASMAAKRAKIPLSICGEMAGDPRYTALLLGMGFHTLSMSPPSIPKVKKRVREIDLVAATNRAALITSMVDSGRIATLVDDFNGAAG